VRRIRRPVLLLDVDGVLNIVGPDYKDRLIRLQDDGHPFHPTEYVLPFMRWAWARFDVVWNTAWRRTANQIADWAGLHRVFAIEETPAYLRRQKRLTNPKRKTDSARWLKERGDWKVDGAREFLGGRTCPVFWIEDGLSLEGHEWVRSRPSTYYLATDSFEGVTPAHMTILEELLRARV
jgi:hypothetical protein